MPRTVFSFTNNNPFYHKQSSAVKTIAAKFKQWLRTSTYCYEGEIYAPNTTTMHSPPSEMGTEIDTDFYWNGENTLDPEADKDIEGLGQTPSS